MSISTETEIYSAYAPATINQPVIPTPNRCSKLTPISQPKNLIPNAQISPTILSKPNNRPRELNTHRLRRLRRNRVLAFSLEKIHPVQAEGFDLDQGIVFRRLGARDGIGDVEGVGGAGFVFYCLFALAGSFALVLRWVGLRFEDGGWMDVPTARMVGILGLGLG